MSRVPRGPPAKFCRLLPLDESRSGEPVLDWGHSSDPLSSSAMRHIRLFALVLLMVASMWHGPISPSPLRGRQGAMTGACRTTRGCSCRCRATPRERFDVYWLIVIRGRLDPVGPQTHEPAAPRIWKDVRLPPEGQLDPAGGLCAGTALAAPKRTRRRTGEAHSGASFRRVVTATLSVPPERAGDDRPYGCVCT